MSDCKKDNSKFDEKHYHKPKIHSMGSMVPHKPCIECAEKPDTKEDKLRVWRRLFEKLKDDKNYKVFKHENVDVVTTTNGEKLLAVESDGFVDLHTPVPLDRLAAQFGVKRKEGAELKFRPLKPRKSMAQKVSEYREKLLFDEVCEPTNIVGKIDIENSPGVQVFHGSPPLKKWTLKNWPETLEEPKADFGKPEVPEIHTFDHSTPCNLPRERYGETCTQCKRDYPYAIRELGFVCWGCKNGH